MARKKRKVESPNPLEGLQLSDFGLKTSSSHSSSARAAIVSESLSTDTRRILRQEIPTDPLKPVNPPSTSDTPFIEPHISSNGYEFLDPIPQDELVVGNSSSVKVKRYRKSDYPLLHWADHCRDDALRVLLTVEARSDPEVQCCSSCPVGKEEGAPEFQRHRDKPLDRIKRWNGLFFEDTSLQDLGLRIQLGHPDGSICPNPITGPGDFVVIHTNKIHRVSLDFCHCPLNATRPHWEQLMLNEWLPATTDRPRTACTFRALEQFHMLSYRGKITAYDYYTTLEKLTDNIGGKEFSRQGDFADVHPGTSGPNFKSRYSAFLRMARQWRHLKELKRAGRGNDGVRKVKDTEIGELGVQCIACPRPDVNLPKEWLDTPEEQRFLYITFIAIDACFRLKNRQISSWAVDPPLGNGWGYFVESVPYREFCKQMQEQKEMCTCTGLSALDHANTKYSTGYRATGVVVQKTPGAFEVPSSSHKIEQHPQHYRRSFNLSYTGGAGQSDGEGIERIWSGSGLLGTSTREMGPGSRKNTCEDYWHHWNWRKTIGLGTLLLKRMKNALREYSRQKFAFKIFEKNQAREAQDWMKMVEDFEKKKTDVNPFELPQSDVSIQDIRAELAEEDRTRDGQSLEGSSEGASMTPSQYVYLLIEVEEQQRQLALDVKHERSPTKKQRENFSDRRTRIEQQIERVRSLQKTHCPEAVQLLTTDPSVADDDTLAEHKVLVFPSELPTSRRNQTLAHLESRYRDGQCSASLDAIRHGLLVKRRLYTYKTNHVRKQKQSARSRTMLDNQQRKIDLAAATYRHAWKAKCRLVGEESVGWHKLLQEDVRMLEDDEEERRKEQRSMKSRRKEAALVNEHGGIKGIRGAGETRRLVSWIWVAADGQTGLATDDALYAGLRVEFCKAYSRVRRWKEEIQLLQEEMRRCLVSLEHQAKQWEALSLVPQFNSLHAEGASAYGHKQAAVKRKIADRFRGLWASYLFMQNIDQLASDERANVISKKKTRTSDAVDSEHADQNEDEDFDDPGDDDGMGEEDGEDEDDDEDDEDNEDNEDNEDDNEDDNNGNSGNGGGDNDAYGSGEPQHKRQRKREREAEGDSGGEGEGSNEGQERTPIYGP
ncbi:hypothetical protein F5880DRAFT_1614672 [Lentinula raphanica]|nr:hypothetical protein F5880DRAFT_1614672 [Lentinula raphanica]